jgi:hypothetical protein
MALTSSTVFASMPGLQQQIPASEYAALVDFYSSTHESVWINEDGWNNPAAPYWFGVTVNGFDYDEATGQVLSLGSVTALTMVFNGLWGTLPESLGDLVNLEHLVVRDNGWCFVCGRLYGPIPDSIGNLTRLRELDLSFNELSGEIPASFANLSNLEVLNLRINALDWTTMPEWLGTLTKLRVLDLARDGYSWEYVAQGGMSGSIPENLGNLTNLQFLELSYHRLSGRIPDSLGNLIALQRRHG